MNPQDRTFPVGTRIVVLDEATIYGKGRATSHQFQKGRTFELTDSYRDGTMFFKYERAQGVYDATSFMVTANDVRALIKQGKLVVEGEDPVVPEEARDGGEQRGGGPPDPAPGVGAAPLSGNSVIDIDAVGGDSPGGAAGDGGQPPSQPGSGGPADPSVAR